MARVIVFGSLNIDLTIQSKQIPQAGETIEGEGFMMNAGGKGGNQAVAAAKLGADTSMIACVGEDTFGTQLVDVLKQYQVECTKVQRRNEEQTGIAMIICYEHDNRILVSSGANHALLPKDVEKLLEKVGDSGDIFVTQYECRKETVSYALKCANAKGMYTIFNPAPAKQIPEDLYPIVDLLVVNQTECQFFTGILPAEPESCKQAICSMKQHGVKNVIITLGELGSISLIDQKLVQIPAYRIPVVDTTAAGDSYIGALAVGISRGWRLQECMEYATKASALAITKLGAQQAIPYEEEVTSYFQNRG